MIYFFISFFAILIALIFIANYFFDPSVLLRPYSGPPPLFSFKTSIGTGFFVNNNGYILTNKHVVKDCTRITTSGYGFEARLVKEVMFPDDKSIDLALLKTSQMSPAELQLSNQDWPISNEGKKVGSQSIDKALRLIFKIDDQSGMLISFSDKNTPIVDSVTLIPSATTFDFHNWLRSVRGVFKSGESGGPIIDSSGRVVGILTSIQGTFTGDQSKSNLIVKSKLGFIGNAGLFIPSAVAKKFVHDLGLNLTENNSNSPNKAIVRVYCFENGW